MPPLVPATGKSLGAPRFRRQNPRNRLHLCSVFEHSTRPRLTPASRSRRGRRLRSRQLHRHHIEDANQHYRPDYRERLGFRRFDYRIGILQLGWRQLGADAPPSQARTAHQTPAPTSVKTLNFTKPIRIIPAGMEIRWRMTGSKRAKKIPPASYRAHEIFGPGEFVRRHQEILTPAENHRPGLASGPSIHDGGSEPRAKRPCYDHASERHSRILLRGRYDRGRRDHHLARNRDDGAFESHEPKNSRISAGLHPMEPDFNKMMHEKVSDLGF